MEPSLYQQKARNIVYSYAKSRLDLTDKHVTFGPDEVYVVWFCYTLGNWKALLSTTLPDQRYYEVTHDDGKQQTYLDVYQKMDNICLTDETVEDWLKMKLQDVVQEELQRAAVDSRVYLPGDVRKAQEASDWEDETVEAMIPLVMGEGSGKKQIGEVYDVQKNDTGIHVRARLNDGNLLRGTIPQGGMSIGRPPVGLTTDEKATQLFFHGMPLEEVERIGVQEISGRIPTEFKFGAQSPYDGLARFRRPEELDRLREQLTGPLVILPDDMTIEPRHLSDEEAAEQIANLKVAGDPGVRQGIENIENIEALKPPTNVFDDSDHE